jgi:diacylglycerol kinase (ATP)
MLGERRKTNNMPALFTWRVINTLRYSWQGLCFKWRSEEAFRLELLAFAVLAPLALWLGDNGQERVLLMLPCIGLLAVELLNTAVEKVADRVSTEPHPLAGAATDVGSAAVLLNLCSAPLTGALVLLS